MNEHGNFAAMALGAIAITENIDRRLDLTLKHFSPERSRRDNYRIPKKYKVSTKNLIKRKKQSAQRKARKITKSKK